MHPRCHGQAENISNAAHTNSSTTVTAPVIAQHSVSRRQSNSASTAITVTGNNNSTVLAANLLPAYIPPSSNGTEGEDESVIYRKCYECNINVSYQINEKNHVMDHVNFAE